LMGGVAAALVGGDINLAANAGGNAAQNNFLNHTQWADLKKKLDACKSDGTDCTGVIAAYRRLNIENDNYLEAACKTPSSPACMNLVSQAVAAKDDQINLGIGDNVLGLGSQGRSNLLTRRVQLNQAYGQAQANCAANPQTCVTTPEGLAQVAIGGIKGAARSPIDLLNTGPIVVNGLGFIADTLSGNPLTPRITPLPYPDALEANNPLQEVGAFGGSVVGGSVLLGGANALINSGPRTAVVVAETAPPAVRVPLVVEPPPVAAGGPVIGDLLPNGTVAIRPVGVPAVVEAAPMVEIPAATVKPPVAAGNTNPVPVAAGVEFATINGTQVRPQNYSTLYHGTDNVTLGLPANATAEDIAQQIYNNGLPPRGNNINLIDHTINQAPDRAFRGATVQPISQEGGAGAAYWANENGVVVKFRDVPGYDVNAVLEGQVKTPFGYQGNPRPGELEIAVPGAILPNNIEAIYRVVLNERGRPTLILIPKK
jgi:hypothetical protein